MVDNIKIQIELNWLAWCRLIFGSKIIIIGPILILDLIYGSLMDVNGDVTMLSILFLDDSKAYPNIMSIMVFYPLYLLIMGVINFDNKQEFVFDSYGVHCLHSFGSFSCQWAAIRGIEITNNYLSIPIQVYHFPVTVIPLDQLIAAGCFDDLIHLINANIGTPITTKHQINYKKRHSALYGKS